MTDLFDVFGSSFGLLKKKMCEQLQVTTTPIYSIIIYFNQILSSHQPHTLSLIY